MLGKPRDARHWHCPLSEPSSHTEPQSGEAGPALVDLRLYLTQFTGAFSTTGRATKTGVKEVLPNTQKQTKEDCQIEEKTKKYGPNERTEQNLRKRIK